MFLNQFNHVKVQPESSGSSIFRSSWHEAYSALQSERKSSKVSFGGGVSQTGGFHAIEQASRLCMAVLAQALRDLRCRKESIRNDAYGWIMAGVNVETDKIAMKAPKGREVPVSNGVYTLDYCCEIINMRFAAIGYDVTIDPLDFRKRAIQEVKENRSDILNYVSREFDNVELDVTPHHIHGLGELYARAA